MRTGIMLAGAAGLGVVWCAMAGARVQPEKRDEPKPTPAPAVAGVAVVEVFTSEGCSSCPPADDLAAKLAREAKEKGKSVFVLAMHVDYWDYLGWKDPYAQNAFTKRQRAYAGALGKAGGNGGVFTPEMVVNGAVGFTGSDESQARKEIDKAIASSARLRVEASVAPRKVGEPVKVHATTKGDARWGTVCVAIVEDGLRVEVKSGENGGKSLTHDRVTRAFAQASGKDGAADVELKLPAGVKEEKCRVVVFVQDEKTMRVAGATEIGLETPPTSTPAK